MGFKRDLSIIVKLDRDWDEASSEFFRVAQVVSKLFEQDDDCECERIQDEPSSERFNWAWIRYKGTSAARTTCRAMAGDAEIPIVDALKASAKSTNNQPKNQLISWSFY